MESNLQHLIERPTASTQKVERLVNFAKRGQIRIPTFQRGLKWTSDDVLELFDSIYKGYPIGSLLVRQGPAPADSVVLGPLRVDALADPTAWWVVDGQQRLTALAASLVRPLPIPTTPDDAYVVYFDVDSQKFVAPPKKGGIRDTWVPVAQMLDASALSEWVYDWAYGRDAKRRGLVFEVGKRLREYEVPLYIVDLRGDEDKEGVLKEIFYRTNNAGKAMSWTDVYDALFGSPEQKLTTLSTELSQMGMGKLDDKQLLLCLLAFEGLDPTRNLAEHLRKNKNSLDQTAQAAQPTLRRALSFLRNDAKIPHLRLLPQILPMVILTRYFRQFPRPNGRARRLLVRWVWRTLLGTALFEERTLLRHGVARLTTASSDEHAVQMLLELVPKTLPEELAYQLPKRFDARAAESRLLLLGLSSLEPTDLLGQPIDVAKLIEQSSVSKDRGVAAFRMIFRAESHPANRILLPVTPGIGIRQELLKVPPLLLEPLLASHGISPEALSALQHSQADEFVQLRRETLQALVRRMSGQLAEWGANDRLSINRIVTEEVSEKR